MKIADLFDVNTCDQAVQELSDEDLLVAAVTKIQHIPTDSFQRESLALELTWYAIHCRTAASAAAIVRHAMAAVAGKDLFEAFLKVTHYREPQLDPGARLRRGGKDTAKEIDFFAAQRHGAAVLNEIANHEAFQLTSGRLDGSASVLVSHDLARWVTDAELLLGVLVSMSHAGRLVVLERLWELEEHDLVRSIAAGEVALHSSFAAERFLADLEPDQRRAR